MTIVLILFAVVILAAVFMIGWQVVDAITRAFRKDTWKPGR